MNVCCRVLVWSLAAGLSVSLTYAADLDALAAAQVRAAAPIGADVKLLPAGRRAYPEPHLHCHTPLDSQLLTTRLAPQMEVRFQCHDVPGWLAHRLVVWHVYQPVLVTSRPLARQDAINASTAHFERRDLTQLGYGYITDPSVLGQRYVARPLPAGMVLTPAMLQHQALIRSGDAVLLQRHYQGLLVQAPGLALSNGDQGERVKIRNNSSGKVLEAVVVERGVAEAMP